MAGGSGHRFGGRKQFAALGGRPLVEWSLEAARSASAGVVLVVPGAEAGSGPEVSTRFGADRVTGGGPTRAGSVRAGLAVVPSDAAVIVVHDAVRPLATAGLFARVVDGLSDEEAAGVVPVVPVSDTLKRVRDGRVIATVDRDDLFGVQTPQAFDAELLRAAHRSGDDATDDAGLLEELGATVVTVPGDAWNVKVTRPEDLVMVEALLGVSAP
ncbi:MAG: 2-C-methyl-D-erythritol 4-phosphate cytidylyltransferase [Acidimicrobiales bacterium]